MDGVSQILRIEGDDIQEFPRLLQGKETKYVDFIARKEMNLVLVINPEGILTEKEWKNIRNMIQDMEVNDD